VLARVTDRGRRTLRRVTELRGVGLERLLEPFTPDERAEFADYLDRFVASIDRVVAELASDAR
jgi:DNA-binding MarR family transcriptional regulator